MQAAVACIRESCMDIARAGKAIPIAFACGALLWNAAGAAPMQARPVPLYFEENAGQAESGVGYLARSMGYVAGISTDVLRVAGDAAAVPVEIRFRGASAASSLEPLEPLAGISNYL